MRLSLVATGCLALEGEFSLKKEAWSSAKFLQNDSSESRGGGRVREKEKMEGLPAEESNKAPKHVSGPCL